jgi:hypothetical protein
LSTISADVPLGAPHNRPPRRRVSGEQHLLPAADSRHRFRSRPPPQINVAEYETVRAIATRSVFRRNFRLAIPEFAQQSFYLLAIADH